VKALRVLPPRAAGLVSAAALAAALTALLVLTGLWTGELFATAMLLAAPLYVVTRDSAEHRAKGPEWVPVWERSRFDAGRR
jgi:hypothetical protein